MADDEKGRLPNRTSSRSGVAGVDLWYYDGSVRRAQRRENAARQVFGPDDRPSGPGLLLTLKPGRIHGLAYIRNNGGHYETLYVKTASGLAAIKGGSIPTGCRSPSTR
jgi:hypothetical protein